LSGLGGDLNGWTQH